MAPKRTSQRKSAKGAAAAIRARSWEKEFPRSAFRSRRRVRGGTPVGPRPGPGIRISCSARADAVRRAARIDESVPGRRRTAEDEVEEVLEALASDARTRIAHVRDGLRSILRVLSSAPGTVVIVRDNLRTRAGTERSAAPAKRAAASRPKRASW